MEKLLYEEKNIGSARKIVIGVCAGIFLLIGILIFCFDAQIPDISYYSGTKTALTVVGIVFILYAAFNIASVIAMNKSQIKIYDNHIEGWQYSVVFAKNYYISYKDITGIQADNSSVIIYAQGKQYGHKSKNFQKIYNILMEQWKPSK